ncbi:sensor histidine kinase [Saccharopolyspora erythraea]|nr:sensor histidine kinase [Saccharopolyspora erythraea]
MVTAVVIVATLLVASVVFSEVNSKTGPDELVLDVVVGALGCALLIGLFRWPIPIAITLAALAALSPTATPLSTAATLQTARGQRANVAGWVALAGVVGHAIYGLWRPMPGLSYAWWLVLDVVVHAGLFAWGALGRARRALIGSLQERARRAEAEQGRRVAEARAAERTALAREMHDVLAHRLSLVATYAGALEYRQDAEPARLAHAAGIVRDGVHQALDELRDVISVLRDDAESADPPQLDLADLTALVEENRAAGTPVHFENQPDELASLPASTGRTGYRIVQEGLTNARKHAARQPVSLIVSGGPGTGLRIEIRNPVPDTPATVPGSGTGLIGLTERVRLTGGRLDHELTGSGEFQLRASLPWPV